MNKSIAIVIIVVSVLAMGAYLLFNEYGFIKEVDVKKEISEVQSGIDSTNMRIVNLKKEIDSLKTNREKIEHVARERYNFRGKNEKVLDIEVK